MLEVENVPLCPLILAALGMRVKALGESLTGISAYIRHSIQFEKSLRASQNPSFSLIE